MKVYAVGQYGTSEPTFVLKMSYGVGAEKMANGLVDALKPRFPDGEALVEEFKNCLVNGLPDGAPGGTCMEFATAGGSLALTVNGKKVGAIESKPLTEAFCGIYCDDKAVCKMQDPPASTE